MFRTFAVLAAVTAFALMETFVDWLAPYAALVLAVAAIGALTYVYTFLRRLDRVEAESAKRRQDAQFARCHRVR
jgi:hypothetical protein